MGSWNGTCFLSNLSINSGDRIHLQLLIKEIYNKEHDDVVDLDKYTSDQDPIDINGYTECTALYKPYAFPIEGKYSDYGSINDIITDNTSTYYLTEKIKYLIKSNGIACLQSVDTWISRIRDVPNNNSKTKPINPDNLEEFFDDVERGLVLVKNNVGLWVRLKFVMMHSDVYNNIITNIMPNYETGWGHNETLKDEINEINKKLKEILKNFRDSASLTDGEKLIKKFSIQHDIRELCDYRIAYDNYDGMDAIWDDIKRSDEYIKLCSERYLIYVYLTHARKLWCPTSGCGSQDSNIDLIKKTNTIINKFTVKYNKELEERYRE